MRWFRGNCLRVNEGEVVSAGTSENVQQLTGQHDFPSREPFPTRPNMVFEERIPARRHTAVARISCLAIHTGWTIGCAHTRDVIAFTESRSATNGLQLRFHRQLHCRERRERHDDRI